MDAVKEIRVERRGPAGIVTLVNPERRNAFTPDMRRALVAALDELGGETDIRAIVLRGDGAHFCSGADLSASAPRGARTLIQHREYNKEINQLTRAIAMGPKPVIAAVEGAAAGAGMGVASACDVVVAARNAKFVPLFTRLGVVPEIGILYTLAQRIGASRARRILMASTPLEAERAYELGLVDELVEPGATFERALEVVGEFEQSTPLSVALVKEAFANGVHDIAEAGRIEVDFVPLITRTDDTIEGVTALREKRAAKFTGF